MSLYEQTIKREVSFSGTGLFTGHPVFMNLCPAPAGSGIVFCRKDLPGEPEIPARLESVIFWPRCTKLEREGASVQMVEHLLSALSAYRISNVRIELNGPEVPPGDGSSLHFVEGIGSAGIEIQKNFQEKLEIREPLYWSEGNVHLIALPAAEFRVSYTLHYPQSRVIGTQFYSFAPSPEAYAQEIAPCRTFSMYEEIAPFIEKGFLKGGGLENALVIQGDRIMNPEGARFPDEMVRHKVLDLLGDLALIGKPLLGHVIAIRSGHASNVAFGKKIAQHNIYSESL